MTASPASSNASTAAPGQEWSHRPRRLRLDRLGLRPRPSARPRRLRRRRGVRDHRKCTARARGRVHAARARVEPLHRSAAAMGACTGHRGGSRRAGDTAPRARQPRTWACGLGLAGASSPPCRLVVLGRTPFAPQLVTSRTALPGALRPSARRGRRCLRDGCGGVLQQPRTGWSNVSRERASSVLELRRCGTPTVVLFNGLGERTPSWAWVQRSLSSETRVCAFDRAGQGWSGAAPGRQDGHELASDAAWPAPGCGHLGAVRAWPGTPPAAPTRSCTPRSTHRKSRGSP